MISSSAANNRIRIRIPEPEKVFTKVYWRLDAARQRFVVNRGGTGSSKSFSSAQKEVLLTCKSKIKTLVIRKVGNTLRDSVIPSFRSRINEFSISQFFEENKSERVLRNTVTGSEIIFRGLDDPEKMKSIEGIDRILVEEATELDLVDLYELNRRMRGRPNPQITLNFNPIDERHWLKKYFYDNRPENADIIESTYKDNPFLSAADGKEIERMKIQDYNQYRIYALNEWGVIDITNPWLRAFDRDKHVSAEPLKIRPDYPINISFDFNIDPLTCIIEQHSRHYGPGCFHNVLAEYELKDTTVKEMCKMLKDVYRPYVLTVTGDATGRNRNAGYSSGNDNLWKQVQQGLGLASNQILVPGSNPSHKNSRALCNYVLQEHPNFKIDPGCKRLIDECTTARPIETDNQDKEDQLLKGAGNSDIGYNIFDCFRYSIHTHHHSFKPKGKI